MDVIGRTGPWRPPRAPAAAAAAAATTPNLCHFLRTVEPFAHDDDSPHRTLIRARALALTRGRRESRHGGGAGVAMDHGRGISAAQPIRRKGRARGGGGPTRSRAAYTSRLAVLGVWGGWAQRQHRAGWGAEPAVGLASQWKLSGGSR